MNSLYGGCDHEQEDIHSNKPSGALLAIMLSSVSLCRADEMYTNGETVDIDRDVLGYLWIEYATVNLHPGAHVKNDYSMGDIFAASGAVLNIYGGQIDNILIITTAYNDLPDALVTVYGTDFAVDGVPVESGTTEVFMANEQLSGLYEDGTSFSFTVECFQEGSYALTIKLNWLDFTPPESEPDPLPIIEVSQTEAEFGQVELNTFGEILVTIDNIGSAPLVLYSLTLEQDPALQFYTTVLQQLPLSIEPNGFVEIGLLYAPLLEGQASAVLVLGSNDPEQERLEIALRGEGFIQLTPAEQIESILAFFEESVENGSLEGTGKNKDADHRIEALSHLLNFTQYLIQQEKYQTAVQLLEALSMKTDGIKNPRDLAMGEALPELNEKITVLIESLQTQ